MSAQYSTQAGEKTSTFSSPISESPRAKVLSIQSHVVSGYVGNKAITFPLQLLGFDVDPLNTVHFCNHTGYSLWSGEKLSPNVFEDLVKGLRANGLSTQYTHLLSGYVGNQQLLKTLGEMVKEMRSDCENLIYVCDPVLGDNDELYVPKECINLYLNDILPYCDIITPNHFEAALLTGICVDSIQAGFKACDALHEKFQNLDAVVISSVPLCATANPSQQAHLESAGEKHKTIALDPSETLTIVASKPPHRYTITLPKISGYFTGTGDLFSAQILAWHYIYPDDFKTALEKSVSAVYSVLMNTSQRRTVDPLDHHKNLSDHTVTTINNELEIVRSKEALENPKIYFKAKVEKVDK